MKIINGVYAFAKVFTTKQETNQIDDYAVAQIKMLCDNEVAKDCKIRVMPDVHPGKVGTIGFTMTVGKRILPMVVGIDLGCGMTIAKIKTKKMEFERLDKVIRELIPAGYAVRKNVHRFAGELELERLHCFRNIQKQRADASLGTLGSGNHFIEIEKDEEKNYYILVHTGSRHLGKEVTDYYMEQGQRRIKAQLPDSNVPYELTYLEGDLMEQYLHDVEIVQEYAKWNRQAIISDICRGMKWKIEESYTCVHNYISEDRILRKGAISAKAGEKVIIPINMRDGVILGTGLGNEDWNCSAPHGAGRIMKREYVKSVYTVSEFKKAMKGIYTTCISKHTLDEAPFAYRAMDDLVNAIGETVKIEKILKPVYNYKDSRGC